MDITIRDIELLQYLHDQGVATSDQLTRCFFPSKSSFKVRISKLIESGFIDSHSLSSFAKLSPSRFYDLRQKAISDGKKWHLLKVYSLRDLKSEKNQLSTPIFWQHQIGLNDIRFILTKTLSKERGEFFTDPEIKREWARFSGFGDDVPIPDLLWRGGSKNIAIEYERTNKGENRYLIRMLKYSRSKYDKILYIASDDKIFNMLIKCSKRVPKIGVCLLQSMNKVCNQSLGYVTLHEFLKVDNERS